MILVLWLLLVRAERSKVKIRDYAVLGTVLTLGLGGAFLASIYNLPDSDDHAYVPNAVHYLTFPDDLMGNEIHYVFSEGDPILSVVVGTAQPFEYAQALLAGFLGIEYLTLYYIFAVAAVGFAIPLAVFILLASFTDDPRNAVIATLITVIAVTILGETKYSFGSLSFTRLFQGKIVLLAAGLPLFSAISLQYLNRPSTLGWFYVGITAVALSGLSSTAYFLVPMLALAIGLAYMLAIIPNFSGLRLIVTYGLALAYPVVYGLYASQTVTQFREVGNPLLAGWPADFLGHLGLLLDLQRPVSLLLILVCLMIIVMLCRGYRRNLLLIWVALDILLFLNPISGQFWIDNVIGPSIYWRVFLLLPIFVIVGLAVITLLERLTDRTWKTRTIAAAAAVTVLFGYHFAPGTTSIFRRGGEIGLPSYKLDRTALEASRWIVGNIAPGPMLAPPDIAGVVGMLKGGYPQLHFGNRPLLEWMAWNDAQSREWASYYADGDSTKEAYFRSVVEQLGKLRIVILGNGQVSDVSDFLISQGFVNQMKLEGHTAYWR